ncbi:D-aminoacyl-tRNA deacylase [Salibacter sp.]|uniref:D-aminoacyl-tRNA deacylase n=1 Tax=Salibacter sp. TaxID=2010995 RepID=UPI00286FBF3B|nr:D-aminoacyl-tRNA deacylase [Salibacter sp.]MDR9488073.1 D-aminoacyl-tRNA deacylase [Salibacter sp.]
MRALIQRSGNGKVVVDDEVTGEISSGLVVLLGIGHDDTEEDLDWIVRKTVNMRLFEGSDQKEVSVLDTEGEVLLVSQFTLHASTKKGNRPSYINAAKPDIAEPMYEKAIRKFEESGVTVRTGKFGAHMEVSFTNDGPVTIWLDSKNKE